jgi:Flp pilus assembly protein TadD
MTRRARRAVLFFVLLVPLVWPGFASASSEEMRDVRVRIVADEEWRRDPGWESRAGSLLRAASAEFERVSAVRLVPAAFGGWESEDAVDSMEALADALESRADKEGCDILVALTAQPNLAGGLFGYSIFKEGLVMIRASDDAAAFAGALKHEIGHLFGAVHVSNPASVMDVFLQGKEFDPLNREAIRLLRDRPFNTIDFPIPKPVRPRAIELYTRICAVIESADLQRKLDWLGGTGVRALLDESGRRDTLELDDAHLLLAQILIEERRYDEAGRAARAALKIRPNDLEAQNILGIVDRKQGRLDEAIAKYRAVLRADPRHPRVQYNLGIAYFRKGDFEAARAAYEQAIELKPRSSEAHNNLGETLLRLGDMAGAEKELGLAAALNPRFALAYANLADLALRRGDLVKARTLLDRARELDAGIPSVWNIAGNLAFREGRPAEAVEHYRRALAVDPDYDKGYFNLGICLFEMNEVSAARDNFRKAVSLNPNFAEAHASLGYCLIKEGRIDDGIDEILLAQKLGFRTAVTHLNLSFAYIAKKRLDEAVEEAGKAISLDPALAPAYNNLGIAYTRKGLIPEAEAAFEKAVKADPRYREGWLNLGNLNYLTGKPGPALERLLEAHRLGPADGALCNNIAVLYYRKGEYKAALEFAEKAVAAGFKVDPGFLAELKKKISGRGGT